MWIDSSFMSIELQFCKAKNSPERHTMADTVTVIVKTISRMRYEFSAEADKLVPFIDVHGENIETHVIDHIRVDGAIAICLHGQAGSFAKLQTDPDKHMIYSDDLANKSGNVRLRFHFSKENAVKQIAVIRSGNVHHMPMFLTRSTSSFMTLADLREHLPTGGGKTKLLNISILAVVGEVTCSRVYLRPDTPTHRPEPMASFMLHDGPPDPTQPLSPNSNVNAARLNYFGAKFLPFCRPGDIVRLTGNFSISSFQDQLIIGNPGRNHRVTFLGHDMGLPVGVAVPWTSPDDKAVQNLTKIYQNFHETINSYFSDITRGCKLISSLVAPTPTYQVDIIGRYVDSMATPRQIILTDVAVPSIRTTNGHPRAVWGGGDLHISVPSGLAFFGDMQRIGQAPGWLLKLSSVSCTLDDAGRGVFSLVPESRIRPIPERVVYNSKSNLYRQTFLYRFVYLASPT